MGEKAGVMEPREYGFRMCRCIWCNRTPAPHRDEVVAVVPGSFGQAWFCDWCWEVWKRWFEVEKKRKRARGRRVVREVL